jgi:Big-like domain-containing protein
MLGAIAAPALAARPTSGTSGVTVSIATPASGASVTSPFLVSGSAKSKNAITSVVVALDGGSAVTASGTSSWSLQETAGAGSHVVRATAFDSRGSSSSATVTVSVPQVQAASQTWSANGLTVTAAPITNPNAASQLVLVGRGRLAQRGDISAVVYVQSGTWAPWVRFRNEMTGAQTDLPAPSPYPTGNNWLNASWALDGSGGFWIFGGGGPVTVWRYSLSGSPLPTSMNLVSSTNFGDSDSRANDLVSLASGALVLSWYQQGQTGPRGLTVAYRSLSSTWSAVGPLSLWTMASKWATAQHPVDGSVWIFGNSDSSGVIAGIHLHEANGQLALDWTNQYFISVAVHGDDGPEAENPDVEAAPDPSAGTIVLAYQGHLTQYFNGGTVKGAQPVVARVGVDGSLTFTRLPQWVERVTKLGLVVQPGAAWVAYHPIDPATFAFSDVYSSRLASSAWQGPVRLGNASDPWGAVGSGVGAPNFLLNTSDGSMMRDDLTAG